MQPCNFRRPISKFFSKTFVSKLTLFNNSSHQIIFSGTCMRRSIEYSVFLTHDPFIYAAFCRLLSSLKLTAHPKNVTFRKTQHTAWFSTRVSPPDLPPPLLPFQANPLVTPGLITPPITVICTYHILQI